MPVLQVTGGEDQGGQGDDGGEEEEDKRIAQLHNTVLSYSAASCLLVEPFATNKSVLYYPRLITYVVGS